MKPFITYLERKRACSGALDWLETQKSPQAAWEACERPDWMFWLLGRTPDVDAKKIVLSACRIVRGVLHHARGKEALAAIEAAEGWCVGDVSSEGVMKASDEAIRVARINYPGPTKAAKASLYVGEAASSAARAAVIHSRDSDTAVLYSYPVSNVRSTGAASDAALFALCTASPKSRYTVRTAQAEVIRHFFPRVPFGSQHN